jgi:hypothetical protein
MAQGFGQDTAICPPDPNTVALAIGLDVALEQGKDERRYV